MAPGKQFGRVWPGATFDREEGLTGAARRGLRLDAGIERPDAPVFAGRCDEHCDASGHTVENAACGSSLFLPMMRIRSIRQLPSGVPGGELRDRHG